MRFPRVSEWPPALRSRRLQLGLAGGLIIGTLAAWGLPHFALSKIEARAEARGIHLASTDVSPGFFSVGLSKTELGLEGVTGLTISVDRIDVALSPVLRPKSLVASGVAVRFDGTQEDLVRSLSEWRARHTHASEPGGAVPLSVRAEGISLRIDHPGSAVALEGATIVRDDGALAVSFATASVERRALRIEAEGLMARAKGQTLESLAMKGLRVNALALGPENAVSGSAKALGAAEPKGAAVKAGDAPSEPKRSEQEAPLAQLPSVPDVQILRTLLDHALAEVSGRLAPGAKIDVDTLALAAADGRALGTGKLSLSKTDAGGIAASFATIAEGSTAPLTFTANLEPAREATLRLKGGPISLKLLGVAEGAAGLIDTDRAELSVDGSLVLSAPGDALSFDGNISLRRFGISLAKVAKDPVRGVDVEARASAALSRSGELTLDRADVSMGAFRFFAKGVAKRAPDETSVDLSFEVPKSSCDVLLKSLPPMLVPDLEGVGLAGDYAIKGRTSFRTTKLDDLVLDVKTTDTCRFVDLPELLKKDRFSGPFLHRVYTPDHEIVEEEMGPGTDNWTPLEEISPFMQVAVLTTEDGAFHHHRGFSVGAIKNSLIANLKAGRFIRGASTISMQLAKNLFLFRDKTLSRKLEEFVLTDYLESAFTKDEMMELYLNIIEFGPNVYGITNAAEHYFGKLPKELTLIECLFLSSMLPKPVKDHWVVDKGLPESWLSTLRTYVRVAEKNGKISGGEANAALADKVVFRLGEKTARVKHPARPRHSLEDESDWKPVQ